MSLRLILTRHAKSGWDDPLLGDHDRPLNARGRGAAEAIGDWLAREGYLPDQLLCSTARRTRETWERIAARLPGPAAGSTFLPELYLAAPDVLLAALHRAARPSVMILAHNPGCGLAARALAAHPPQSAAFARYPTAATAVLTFDAAAWGEVDWGQGRLEAFTVPRDLMAAG